VSAAPRLAAMTRRALLAASVAALAMFACGGSVSPGAQSTVDSTDAGNPATPPCDAGSRLAADITYTETGFNLLAVDRGGTAYGVNLAASDTELWSSADVAHSCDSAVLRFTPYAVPERST